MAVKPPVELSRPTILNLIAILCYCLAILFHIIAFATDNWSSITVQGVRYTIGLWQGCRKNETTDEWHCSTDVFDDEAFKTGKSELFLKSLFIALEPYFVKRGFNASSKSIDQCQPSKSAKADSCRKCFAQCQFSECKRSVLALSAVHYC